MTLDPTLWPGTEINSWQSLAQLCAATATEAASGKNILLRGQPADWPLRPTFLRAVPSAIATDAAAAAERAALDHFRSQAHLHDQTLQLGSPDGSPGFLEWWALMQHHGAPTRLLDWTASPYVAAYFAVEQGRDTDGVVLVIDADALQRQWNADFGGSVLERSHFFGSPPAALRAATPFHKTARLVTQQGYFTVATRPTDEHDALLAAAGAIRRRWIIPARLKPTILLHLRTMNVTANALFPGLDGLGRSVSELIRTAHVKVPAVTA